MALLIPIAVALVGAVFVLAALLKALESLDFLVHVGRLLSRPRIFRAVRHGLPFFLGLEAMLGTALIVGLWPRWLVPPAFFAVLGFAAVSGWGVASGRVKDCGCYGGPIVVSPAASLALDAAYAVVLGAAWFAGHDAPAAPWKLVAVAVAGVVITALAEFGIRYGQKARRPLVDWSPIRTGRPWRSRWLGHPDEYALAEGEHLVALLSLDCTSCKGWLKALNVIHQRPDLPQVVAAYAASEEQLAALREEGGLIFPVATVSRLAMNRLARMHPRGVLVDDGVVREVWHGVMPPAFIERLRAGAPKPRPSHV